jgi:cbb3-type cytochrome oxidase subunit 3
MLLPLFLIFLAGLAFLFRPAPRLLPLPDS